MNAPKLFISYCWSTPDHEQWVIDLATELTQSGIEVILDKWDLKEGHDAVAFMEQMVTDTSIKKVLIICDRAYAEKADGRKGGVGTETQIISHRVYESTSQDKFVAVVAEKDDEGKPFLPAYYKSRIYIDLSESNRYTESFEKLVRWIYDRPLLAKPALGKPPAFITESNPTTLGTSALAKRAIEGIKSDKGYARGAFDEYLNTFAENLERFRIDKNGGEIDDLVVNAIEAFAPSRNEFLQVLWAHIQYGQLGATSNSMHHFLESLLPYYDPPIGQNSSTEMEFDQFKFIAHELFLYAIASYVRSEDYDSANHLLTKPYYIPKNPRTGWGNTAPFRVFREYLKSLEHRNQQKKLNRISLRADILEQRAKNSGMPFQLLMQADFICYLRAELTSSDSYYDRWFPDTLLYATHHYGPFEVFARATSKSYLSRLLPLLGITSTAPIKTKLEQFSIGDRLAPRWSHESINPATLMGFDELGSKA